MTFEAKPYQGEGFILKVHPEGDKELALYLIQGGEVTKQYQFVELTGLLKWDNIRFDVGNPG